MKFIKTLKLATKYRSILPIISINSYINFCIVFDIVCKNPIFFELTSIYLRTSNSVGAHEIQWIFTQIEEN